MSANDLLHRFFAEHLSPRIVCFPDSVGSQEYDLSFGQIAFPVFLIIPGPVDTQGQTVSAQFFEGVVGRIIADGRIMAGANPMQAARQGIDG